jgi:hypothetical protein
MAIRKYFIQLSQQEIDTLNLIVKSGTHAARVILHALILLASNADENGKMKTQASVAQQYLTTGPTVSVVRKNYVTYGLDAALYRKEYDKSNKEIKLDGALEAHIISIACSEPPKGRSRWTLKLIADKTVELGFVDSISHTLVATALKKTNFNLI